MTKIESMYRWSGGTDYRHTCYECPNLKKIKTGKRQVYKCTVYGMTSSTASDWKASYIACRFFGQTYTGKPVMEQSHDRQQEEEQIPGQMSIFDMGL